MHDRVDARAPVMVLFQLGVVGKEALHLGRAAAEGKRIVRADDEVELAALEELAELGAGRCLGNSYFFWNSMLQAIGPPLDPLDALRLHAVLVLQQHE